jgi:hypothetical protein
VLAKCPPFFYLRSADASLEKKWRGALRQHAKR